MNKIYLILFLLLPVFCFGQGPGTSTVTDVSGSGEYMQVFRPYNYTTGLHPLVCESKGAGEVNTFNLTPLSLGDFGKNYNWTGRYINTAKGGTSTVYVITIHAAATVALVKLAITWAKANLPGVDTTQMIFNGWSLGGGAGLDIVSSDTVGPGSTGRRLSAVVLAAPVAASSGSTPTQVYPGLNKTHLPVFLIDATNDGNGATNFVTSGILSTKQSGGLSTTPEVQYYFPNTNNTAYQANGGHQAAQMMMNDTTVGSKNVRLDSSYFTGHSNTNALVSVRNIMEQALAYQKGSGGGGGSNIAPVANAGANQIVDPPATTATLTGSGTDADGTITAYSWAKTSGPALGSITSPSSATTTVTGLTNGVYVFTLTVTDNGGATGSASMTINVDAPPVAEAGPNRNITLPKDSVHLSASGSYDPDGYLVGYSWVQNSGPNTATFSAATSVNTDVTGMIAGTYVFKINVADNNIVFSSDTVIVVVNAAPVVPSCTTNSTPANAATLGTQTTATLIWNNAATATSFNVYLYLNGGSIPGSPTYTVSGTSQSVTGLTAGLTYKWFVTPVNGTGPAVGCSTSATTFTTQAIVISNPYKTLRLKRRGT